MNTIDRLINGESFLEILRTCEDDKDFLEKETKEINDMTITVHGQGLLEFTPKEINSQTKSILLSCAIHGNETAPIEIVDEIISKIFKENNVIRDRILFIYGNPKAIWNGTRFIEYNLNRLFSDAYKNYEDCYEKERAKEIQDLCHRFFKLKNNNFHYDLHTAIRPSDHQKFAIFPCTGKDLDELQVNFLKAMKVSALVRANEKTTTFSHYTQENFNSYSFTLELGKVHPFGQNPVDDFVNAKETIEELIFQSNFCSSTNSLTIYEVYQSLIKNKDDFKFNPELNLINFKTLPTTTYLYEEDNKKVLLEKDKLRVLFANENVANGQRAALILKEDITC